MINDVKSAGRKNRPRDVLERQGVKQRRLVLDDNHNVVGGADFRVDGIVNGADVNTSGQTNSAFTTGNRFGLGRLTLDPSRWPHHQNAEPITLDMNKLFAGVQKVLLTGNQSNRYPNVMDIWRAAPLGQFNHPDLEDSKILTGKALKRRMRRLRSEHIRQSFLQLEQSEAQEARSSGRESLVTAVKNVFSRFQNPVSNFLSARQSRNQTVQNEAMNVLLDDASALITTLMTLTQFFNPNATENTHPLMALERFEQQRQALRERVQETMPSIQQLFEQTNNNMGSIQEAVKNNYPTANDIDMTDPSKIEDYRKHHTKQFMLDFINRTRASGTPLKTDLTEAEMDATLERLSRSRSLDWNRAALDKYVNDKLASNETLALQLQDQVTVSNLENALNSGDTQITAIEPDALERIEAVADELEGSEKLEIHQDTQSLVDEYELVE
ncbi:hypothetical protein [Marinibactrum halimedae]|uniref:Uncharacterized protein n=1 Tax=Marinibactrum halimedae TaxID=1444977 RepID=A0AA37WL70_9GAMM|nr:hypothetical protein [Marinibactrum halimedae]MCD9458077.1 hypothetical protein [Marinibactrum halimedae]GLS25010.1 hypothetical protein GCM10007877_07240 [Marinibactrum halimedae]